MHHQTQKLNTDPQTKQNDRELYSLQPVRRSDTLERSLRMRILILAVLCFYHQATIHPCLGQPMNATCQGTKSNLTIGCTLYKNVPITLDLKCKEQESHSTVCLCQENNCQCPSVNYSVTENSPIKREIVISGFNCEPEALVCNPISGELDSPSSHHPSYTLTNCTLTSRENEESSLSVLVAIVIILSISGATGVITLAICWKNCCGIRDKFSDICKATKVTSDHQDDKENNLAPLVQKVEARALSSHTAEQEQKLFEKDSEELGIVRKDLNSPVIKQPISCKEPEAESDVVPSRASRQIENKYRVDHQELPTGSMENNGAMTCRV